MKYLLLALIGLSACSPSKKMSNIEKLSLVEASVQSVTGGMHRTDGKSSAASYKLKLLKPNETEILGFWIQGLGFDFEQFEYEGYYYVNAKVYHKNQDNVTSKEFPIATEAIALLQYKENGELKYLEIEKFEVKEAVQGN